MQTAFERIIADLPRGLTCLDVGYGGLDGENTTNYLRAHFKEVWGLCKDAVAVRRYKEFTGSKDLVVLGIYPQHMPLHWIYDVLVLDTNIEGNLDFWSEEGMERAWSFVKDGGFIITYLMAPDGKYGGPETQKLIQEHKKKWWVPNREIRVVAAEVEERRPEITWVLLRKP